MPRLGERSSGVLLHVTSLPGGPCGDLGPSAREFVNWLATARQRWWQMLPIGPPGYGNSPYQAFSAFAGNPLLISLDDLADDGLLPRAPPVPRLPRDRVDFPRAWRFKEPHLRAAFAAFERRRGRPRAEFEDFCVRCGDWLDDWALFAALKERFGGRAWTEWPEDLRDRQPGALEAARAELVAELRYQQFLQFTFERQWQALRARCRQLGVGLIGDLPIFAAHDSADVWADRSQFLLDARGEPEVIAGVPPDYFSTEGQRWGNPLYRWDRMRQRGYDWWVRRLRALLARFDAVRIDHFIGFHRAWHIPRTASSAKQGKYVPGPGADFFTRLEAELGHIPVIAEDLGVVVPEVKALREQFGLPGMRVLQFAFGTDPEAESYQPHNYPRGCVVYTGTHDNDTTVGWYEDRGGPSSTRSAAEIAREHAFALRYLGSDGSEIHWDMIRLAWLSVGDTAIAPLQDVLGFGAKARMNRPGTSQGNWEWRATPGALTPKIAARLALMTCDYGRGG